MSGVIEDGIVQGPARVSSDTAKTPLPSSDEEIYCPICNYNLTGILTGRCPECGSLFDREALIANQQAHRITLIPWDDPAEKEFCPRFKKTLRICLFDAKRFAFAFSVQPQETRASAFLTLSIVLLLASILLLMACCVPIHWLVANRDWEQSIAGDVVTVAIATISAVVITLLTTTYASAAVLGIFCPHFDSKRHFKPWLAISSYAAAHFLLMPLGLPLFVLSTIWGRGMFGPGFVGIALVFWLACGLLSAFTLNAVVRHRAAKLGFRTTAMFLVFGIYSVLPVLIQILTVAVCTWLYVIMR